MIVNDKRHKCALLQYGISVQMLVCISCLLNKARMHRTCVTLTATDSETNTRAKHDHSYDKGHVETY